MSIQSTIIPADELSECSTVKTKNIANINYGGVYIMKKVFRLLGLECANCAAKMETAVKSIDGVESASVNFMTAKMTIEGDNSKFDDIVRSAINIVNKYEPDVVVKNA